jgi:RNA polymerase sigma-70 factor, ECF subfamily
MFMSATTSRGVQAQRERSAALESVMAELYEKSNGKVFGLGCEQFAAILSEISGKYLANSATSQEITDFCAGLRLEELALARACAAGSERAWEIFLTRFREKLFDIAGYIAKESSIARELADSVYADLYGTTLRDGQRVCKLASYSGRGSLEGWLRTVLAQEYVNRYRRRRRLVSLDEESEEGVQFAATETQAPITLDPRVESATDEALAALDAEDRLVLASYYLDERTLAEIACALGVHESTISRKLTKLTKSLRKKIVAILVQKGMSRRQAEEAMEVDVRDLQVNLRQRLSQEIAPQTFPKKRAEAEAGEGSRS